MPRVTKGNVVPRHCEKGYGKHYSPKKNTNTTLLRNRCSRVESYKTGRSWHVFTPGSWVL